MSVPTGRLDAAQRHVLPVGAERGAAAAHEPVVRHPLFGDLVRPVVVDLVVVEGHEPRERGVRGLQVRVGLVLRVALAVVGEVDDLVVGVRADVAARRRVRVRVVLVDVVAEVDDQVEVLRRHVLVGRVVAVLVLLAGRERERQRADGSGRRRLRAPDRADLAVGLEAVEVLEARLQADRLGVHRVRLARHRGLLTARDDLRERFVLGDLPLHLDRLVRHAAAAAQRRRREPRPQHRAVRRRVARRDPERERVAGEAHRPGAGAGERELRCRDHDPRPTRPRSGTSVLTRPSWRHPPARADPLRVPLW